MVKLYAIITLALPLASMAASIPTLQRRDNDDSGMLVRRGDAYDDCVKKCQREQPNASLAFCQGHCNNAVTVKNQNVKAMQQATADRVEKTLRQNANARITRH
ncbi:hypothetical protein C8J56DRAFT_409175 [Mycena floridula]|nr:hypothetical protein C8J56DRAFT_409175 [Mycena floridula]